MRRSVGMVAWTAATVGACALAWSAVDQVAARVTDHTSVIGDRSIRASLRVKDHRRHGSGGAGGTEVAAAIPNGSSGASGPAPANGSETPSAADLTATATPGPNGSGETTGRTPTGGTTDPPPPVTTPTAPPPPPTTRPTSANASVFVVGGSVTATCSSGAPRLVGAIPSNGFAVSVSPGGNQLVVDFTSSTHHSIVEAECEGAQVHFSTGEESAG